MGQKERDSSQSDQGQDEGYDNEYDNGQNCRQKRFQPAAMKEMLDQSQPNDNHYYFRYQPT
jgi:hypothetical protein